MKLDKFLSQIKANGTLSGLYSSRNTDVSLVSIIFISAFLFFVFSRFWQIWQGPQVMRKCNISSLEKDQKIKLKVNFNSHEQMIEDQWQIFEKSNNCQNCQIDVLENDDLKSFRFSSNIILEAERQISIQFVSRISENPQKLKIRLIKQKILDQPSDYCKYQILLLKIRFALLNLMSDYEEQQSFIFKQLQTMSQTILDRQCIQSFGQSKNALYQQMIEAYQHHTANHQQDEEQNQDENYRILAHNLKKLKFKRFLKKDYKLDQLEIVVDYLNNNLLFLSPITLITVTSIHPNAIKFYVKDFQSLIYFDKKENFCYVKQNQINHFYNLQETLRLAIYQSVDFKNSKLSFDAFLQKLTS